MSRVYAAVAGALIGMVIGSMGLACVDRLLIHPGNPDAGQLGVLGFPIGLLVGSVAGWKLARPK